MKLDSWWWYWTSTKNSDNYFYYVDKDGKVDTYLGSEYVGYFCVR